MKKTSIPILIEGILLLIFTAGCGLPGSGGQAPENTTGAARGIAANTYEIRVSEHDELFSSNPTIAWTGNEYGIAWENTRDGKDWQSEIHFTRINKYGVKVMSNTMISVDDEKKSTFPSVVWAPEKNQYGLVWQDNRVGGVYGIYFTILDVNGRKLFTEKKISDSSYSSVYPCVAWNGSEYGVVWQDSRNANSAIYYTRINANGTEIIKDLKISDNANAVAQNPSLVWTGSDYGITWENPSSESGGIYFTRIKTNGTKIINDKYVLENGTWKNTRPALAWTGKEYGIPCQSYRGATPSPGYEDEIFFARINTDGKNIKDDTLSSKYDVYNSHLPSIVWTGSEYGVAYEAYTANDHRIHLLRFTITSTGGFNILSTTSLAAGSAASCTNPMIVWNGSGYGVVWQDNRDTSPQHPEIFFARTDRNGTTLPQQGLPQGSLSGTLQGSKSGYYYIRSVRYGTFLTHRTDSNTLSLEPYSLAANQRQKWQLSQSGYTGWYKVISDKGRRIEGNPTDNTLAMVTSSHGGSPVLFWFSDGDSDGQYYIKNKVDQSYRIYANSASIPVLSTNWYSGKWFEIIKAN